jgi:hypothetical protein
VSNRKINSVPVTVLLCGAVLAAVASLVWGALVYSQVAKMSGEPSGAYMHCLVLISDSCNFYRGMGWLQGLNPYEPLVFWWALSLVGVAGWVRWRNQRAVA